MALNRLATVVAALLAHSSGGSLVGAVCATAMEVAKVAGVGLALHGNGHRGPVCSGGVGAAHGEDSQVLLGVGPGFDAFANGVLVEESDLGAMTSARWPAFDQEMLSVGIGSVASFPLQFGAARFGALSFYSLGAGRLSFEQTAIGYVVAQVAAYAVVGAQAKMADQVLASEIEAGFTQMAAVHQATGMIVGFLGIAPEEAMVRLRAMAFAAGRSLIGLASEIVAGRFEIEAVGNAPQA